MENAKRFTIGKKMYIFIITNVLFAAGCVCALSYIINADQINTYYSRLTINNAKNYSTLVDKDFLKELRALAESDEYQALREEAEEADDDTAVYEYFVEQGIWDKFNEEREKMRTYVNNMEDVKYLYIVAWSEHPDPDGSYRDMYIIDADDVPLYMVGYYEDREEEFGEVDYTKTVQPTITHGDWGWLCSGYEPLYDDDGTIICHIGCDVDMGTIIGERNADLFYMVFSALVVTIIALVGSIIFVARNFVKPIRAITADMKKFSPEPGKDYIESGVTNIFVKREDEIGDIYGEIQQMQKRIVDYINDITNIKQDKEEAEVAIKIKDQEIGQISKEAFKDALTGVGNLNAYKRKSEEINEAISKGYKDFAVVMMDANGLKYINDNFGHTAGDSYLRGNSHIICEIFKHSPVFRIGGDEFVAILHGDDYKNREERVDALRKVFEKAFNDQTVQPWERYSVSVGIAEYTSEDKTVDDVFKRADKSMYEDKDAFKKHNAR